MPEFICPHCEAEIDHFNYSIDTTGTEWGRANFNSRTRYVSSMNFDCLDSETSDTENLRLECPRCDESIDNSLIDDFLETHYSTEENGSRPTQTTRMQTAPISDSPRIITKQEDSIDFYGATLKACETCSYQYLADQDDECPRCSITKIKLTI